MQLKKSALRVKGMIIVFEGVSGCGKSENVEVLRRYFTSKGYKTVVIEWNSNQAVRKIINIMSSKNILTPNIYSLFQWISFLLDYFFKIIPLLKKNYVLIADRYIYTGLTRDRVNGAGGALGRFLHRIVIKPSLVFFLDVNPEVCDERIKKRGKILFHTNKRIKESKLLKNKDLYYLNKLRREYLLLFNTRQMQDETVVITIKEDSDPVVKFVQDYISGRREMCEYLKAFD
ncbi:MAG TPA: thymidylate kinase [Ruminiclostridium sp.]|nr:thymidylate kinase [Ruminiclostridium sp.]